MLIIMKKYSRLIFHLVIVIMLAPKFVKSAETPELGDPYSQALSLKTEKIIGLSSYKRLQNYL